MYKSLTAALALVAGIQTASAATITVDSNLDTPDASATDGVCGSGLPGNSCTLRAAIAEANGNGDPSNIIQFAAGMDGQTTTAATAYPPITKALTINGPANRFTVDGDDGLSTNVALFRFTATSAGSYTITKLVLQNGSTTDLAGGGALYFAPVGTNSSLTLVDVDITGSTATAGHGGGMALDIASGTVTLTRVLVSGNTAAAGNGGGLWLRLVSGGSMSLTDSTIAGNAAVNGGGIEVRRGRLAITRATISGNTASADGGGIFLGDDSTTDGSVALENVTISGNTAATGGGIGAASANTAGSRVIHTTIARNTATTGGGIGTAAAQNTIFPGDSTNPFTSNIVAENNPLTTGNNCKESFTHNSVDSGYNRSNNTSCNFNQSSDSQTFDPAWLFDTLQDNAGTTQTHRLLAGTTAAPNTAIDAANPAYANAADQRGAPAADGNADSSIARDIGAYEFAGFGAVQFTAATFAVREDGTPAVIGVQRFGNATPVVTATFSTADGTATGVATCPGTAAANSDYQTVTGATVSFATGQTAPAAAVNVTLCGDPGTETDETVTLSLTNVAAGSDLGARNGATLTIQEVAEGTLQFSAATFSAAESAGTVNATIGVTRTGGSSDAVAITYAINGGTASGGGVDYTDATPGAGTLNWASGDATTQYIVLALNDDAICEIDEIVFFQLSNPTNGATLGSQTTSAFTITDNDGTGAGTLQFENTAYTVNETAGTLTVNVRRVGGCAGDVSVEADNVTVAGDTATEPGDFLLLAAQTLNWPAGDTANKSFDVTIVDDSAVESNQRFSLQLQNASGATIAGTNPVGVTIVSDEQPQLRFDQTSYSRSESGTSVTLNVVNNEAIDGGAVSVSFATADGSATAGVDYTAASGTLTWAAGTAAATAKPITVMLTTDSTVEGNETFTAALGTPTGGAGVTSTNPVTVTIIDPAAVRLAATSFASSAETNASTITVTVERVGDVSTAISVDFAISPCGGAGCATEGVDYTRSGGFSGTLNWPMNDGASKTFAITVLGDTAIEGNETINLALSNPQGGAILSTPSSGTATVTDDDYRFEIVDTSPLAVAEAAGNAVVTVARVGSTVGAATVGFATADGTALAGSDYTQTASPPALSWAASEGGTKTITIPVTSDTVDEANSETFTVALSTPSNNVSGEATSITGSPLTVGITDDDAVTVSFAAATQIVGESAGAVVVTVNRTGSTTFDVSVPVTVSGTAANPADHNAVAGTITIPAASTSATATFNVVQDTLDEANETVIFTMGTPTGGNVTAAAPTTHTVTITDDDATPTLSIADVAVTEADATNVTASFIVTLSAASGQTVTVNYATANGTALAPDDYTAIPTTALTFTPGQTSKTVVVTVRSDSVDEPDETFAMNLSGPTNATLADGAATGTIRDAADDVPPPPSGGGGGSFSLLSLVLLLPAWMRRRRLA